LKKITMFQLTAYDNSIIHMCEVDSDSVIICLMYLMKLTETK
jgi:hypothetical protein